MPVDRIRPVLDAIATGDPAKVRAAAQKQLKRIQASQTRLTQDAKLVRELAGRYGLTQDSLTPKKRSAQVQKAALALVEAGQSIVTSQEILDFLENQGIKFDVLKPASLVGTVLNGMKAQFKPIERNRYAYVGTHRLSTSNEADLAAADELPEVDDDDAPPVE